MIRLASIIERFGGEYLAQYATRVLPSQRKALAAMKLCRSTQGPGMLAQCGDCGEQRVVPHSCGHRNCPHCQHFESQRWIERQTQALVPGSYFLITFTLPAELRPLAWAHQRVLYAALMDCAWQALRTFSHNHRQLQGCPGAVAVLHTHSRKLDFHPHVHVAMPAAALDADKGLWRCLRKTSKGDGYLFNHKALAKVFRAKFLAAVAELGLQLPPGTVSGVEFLRLVLQHVLPRGFRRARNYGFLHPNSKRLIALVRLVVFKPCGKPAADATPTTQTERPKLLCRCCGAAMAIVRRRMLPLIVSPMPCNREGFAEN